MHIVNIYLFTNNTGKAIILVPLFDNGSELHICNSMSIISRNLSVLFQSIKNKDNIVRNENSVRFVSYEEEYKYDFKLSIQLIL